MPVVVYDEDSGVRQKAQRVVRTKRQKIPAAQTPLPVSAEDTYAERMVRRHSAVILKLIARHFPDTPFTRDDVLAAVSTLRLSQNGAEAAGLNDTATVTRYVKVCAAVHFLVRTGRLVPLDHLRLSLAESFGKLIAAPPPHEAYLPTLRRIVSAIPRGSVVDAMEIVDLWKSDQHLPLNMKRMTVRAIVPVLKKEKLLQRGAERHELVRI